MFRCPRPKAVFGVGEGVANNSCEQEYHRKLEEVLAVEKEK
jgi:hypothetical protein